MKKHLCKLLYSPVFVPRRNNMFKVIFTTTLNIWDEAFWKKG